MAQRPRTIRTPTRGTDKQETQESRNTKMSKLRLLIDMDGPLADFDLAFYLLCEDNGATMHGGTVGKDNPCTVHRFATDCIDDKRLRRQMLQAVETRRWFATLEPTPGALEGLNRLAEHPAVGEVFICTKPMEKNITCRDDKAHWVTRYLGTDWTQRLILAPDKSMVRGDVLLDDAPKKPWVVPGRAEWAPVVYPTPWNAPGTELSVHVGLEDAPRWDWTRPIDELVGYAERAAAARDQRGSK